jgi:hypothetical protein
MIPGGMLQEVTRNAVSVRTRIERRRVRMLVLECGAGPVILLLAGERDFWTWNVHFLHNQVTLMMYHAD